MSGHRLIVANVQGMVNWRILKFSFMRNGFSPEELKGFVRTFYREWSGMPAEVQALTERLMAQTDLQLLLDEDNDSHAPEIPDYAHRGEDIFRVQNGQKELPPLVWYSLLERKVI